MLVCFTRRSAHWIYCAYRIWSNQAVFLKGGGFFGGGYLLLSPFDTHVISQHNASHKTLLPISLMITFMLFIMKGWKSYPIFTSFDPFKIPCTWQKKKGDQMTCLFLEWDLNLIYLVVKQVVQFFFFLSFFSWIKYLHNVNNLHFHLIHVVSAIVLHTSSCIIFGLNCQNYLHTE